MPTGIRTHGILLDEQSSAPSSPASGRGEIYYDNNQRAWVKTSAGVLVPLSAGPSFLAHKNGSNQSITTTAGYTQLTFGTEVYDTHGYFASDTFTPLVAGKYWAYLLVLVSSGLADQNVFVATLYKSGATNAEDDTRASGTASQSSRVGKVFDMNGSTDTIQAYIFNGAAGTITVNGSTVATYFGASMIG